MKNYSSITAAYLTAHGLVKCYIRDQLDVKRLAFLTKSEITAMRKRGISIWT